MSFFVLADEMTNVCFRSVGIFQSTINQSINQSIINQYFTVAPFIPQFTSSVGGTVASWLVHSSPDRAVQVPALARDIALCSWARHFTLTVPLSNQAPVVQKVDSTIQRISVGKTNYANRWIVLSTL